MIARTSDKEEGEQWRHWVGLMMELVLRYGVALLLRYQVARQLHCEQRSVLGGERQQGVCPLQVHLPDPHVGPLYGGIGLCPVEEETDPTAQWSDVRIWKMELKGAFTLLSFSPNDGPLFAMELSDDLIT
jgi:hypothetical protein